MSMLKVIEVLAESDEGFDAAARAQASQSVRNIKSVYIKEINAQVDDGKITRYRVNAKISFQLEDQSAG